MTHDSQGDLRHVLAPNPSAMTERGTNTWIVGRGEVAVIDPGPAIPSHLEAILAALTPGERVTHILVTHAHLDHSALAPALSARTGAPVLAFGTAQDGINPAMRALGLAGTGGEGVDAGFVPDRRLEDGQMVEGPDWQLQAIHTPGHLGSHLCFGWGALCFTGDHVMGWSTSLISPPEGDMGAYMASLTRLGKHGWHRFLPGHGAAVPDPAVRLADLTEHRLMREAQILAALGRAPATPAALVHAIYTDLAPPLHPAARRNVLAHLIDLTQRNLTKADPTLDATARFALA